MTSFEGRVRSPPVTGSVAALLACKERMAVALSGKVLLFFLELKSSMVDCAEESNCGRVGLSLIHI